jgi:hypothetical protein
MSAHERERERERERELYTPNIDEERYKCFCYQIIYSLAVHNDRLKFDRKENALIIRKQFCYS